ncbi:MAG: hypothetical protein Q7V48_10540 [Deltaproteobacteria bacterium]|nr:hypothetical protein [Deltaproteobacteria bacterium]
METTRLVGAGSKDEIERIVEKVFSNYSYENKPIAFPTTIEMRDITGEASVLVEDLQLSSENPRVTIPNVAAIGTVFFDWGLVASRHGIGNVTWEKEVSAEAEGMVRAFISPINVPTTYTYMTYEKLLKEYRNVKSENEYFREQLSAINSPQKLQKYSICYGFFSLLFLAIAKIFGIDLVHPILAYFVFGISAFFYLFGILMEKQVEK